MGRIGKALVMGGGIGGVQSALDIANAGYKVYLLDEKGSIGGKMAQLDKTFPTNDCSMCILSPKLVDAGRHKNIELIMNAEVLSLDGNKVEIVRHATYVDGKKCVGCGVCATKCPKKAKDEFNKALSERKAIYIDYPQAVPLIYSIDKNLCTYFKTGKCRLCEKFCQANAINFDDKDEILKIEVDAIIFSPGYDEFDPNLRKEYGYGIYENVLTSMEFERILCASGPYGGKILKKDGTHPKKIAFIQCVGSRDEKLNRGYCSSVCCMYSIKEAIIAKEHDRELEIKIFFIDMRTFGKEFESYYNRAIKEGIKFVRARIASVEENNKKLRIRYEDNGLVEDDFDIIVLAVGLSPSLSGIKTAKRIGIELNEFGFCNTNELKPIETNLVNVFVCGTFSSPKDIPDTVAQGSASAGRAMSFLSRYDKILSLEKYEEKDFSYLKPKIGVIVCHCGINIAGTVDVKDVAEYARKLNNVYYATDVVYACSQNALEFIKEKIVEYKLNRVVVASCTPRTHEPLFRECVKSVGLNPYLLEMANIRDQCSWVHFDREKATEKAKELVRIAVAKCKLNQALKKYTTDVKRASLVIGGGISGITAALELARNGVEVHLIEREKELGGFCKKLPYTVDKEFIKAKIDEVEKNEKIKVYKNAVLTKVEGSVGNFKANFFVNGEEKKIEIGTIIVATGAKEYKPNEYNYGKDKRVITQVEVEEKLSSLALLKNIVMIQCVGSRNEEREYCSKVCCTHAIKNALLLREKGANVYILYKEIRTYGLRENYYIDAREKGIIFIRYEEKPKLIEKDGKLYVEVFDVGLKRKIIINADGVVLSSAIIPNENDELSKILKVPLTKDKFFLEAHMKLRPVDFATDGIFLCGTAHSPKFIDESIASAIASAGRALTILNKEFIESEGIIAEVNPAKCTGCEMCISACPFSAIEKFEGIAKVNATLCKGCGTCSATCNSGAIQQLGFKDEQILAMLESFGET
ncbi:MAG: CoB--CoM heterodisulfide reductase iron-sulfur subunit A family protein [Candidatus Thermoplasmatota archaeon]